MIGVVNVWVSPYGTHKVPDKLCKRVKWRKNGKVDKRCSAFRKIERWAQDNEPEWRKKAYAEWVENNE